LLLKNGAEINATTFKGFTAVMAAAQVKILIDKSTVIISNATLL
jgi:hypothetical protein